MPLLVDAEHAEAALADLLPALLAAQRRTQAAQAATTTAPRTVLAWAQQHRRIDDQPFTLERFAPLRALYEDDHPHICVMKPAQRGVSEWAINVVGFALEHGAAAWAPEKAGLNVGYVFPTVDSLRDFSKERFSGLREETPHLAQLFGSGEFDGVTFKQIGKSYLYLRGGWSTSALRSFAADVLILDEYDELDPEAIALARRRLNASVVRREIDISTPTLPGRGIHALYLQSDQQRYEQPCPGCGRWQTWDFARDCRADGERFETPRGGWQTWPAERVRRATLEVWCPDCAYRLTDADRCLPGRWVAQQPAVTGLRGYALPALAFPFVRLVDLAVAAVSADVPEQQEFFRSDLGQPYQAQALVVWNLEWWRTCRFDPDDPRHQTACIARWISCDTAWKDKDTAAYSTVVVGELTPDYRLFIRDVQRWHVTVPHLEERLRAVFAEYVQDELQGVPKLRALIIEDAASGIGLVDTFKDSGDPRLAERVVAFDPRGTKEQRAELAAVWVKKGCVWLPQPSPSVPWLAALEDELARFPQSKFKDQSDALAQLILYVSRYLAEGATARAQAASTLGLEAA